MKASQNTVIWYFENTWVVATATIFSKMFSAGSLMSFDSKCWLGCLMGVGGVCRSYANIQLQGGLGEKDAWVFNFHSGLRDLPHYYYNKESSFLNLGRGFR